MALAEFKKTPLNRHLETGYNNRQVATGYRNGNPRSGDRGRSGRLPCAQAVEHNRCHLVSTQTARTFYRSAGYSEDGPPAGKFGMSSSYPMSKALVPRSSSMRSGYRTSA